MLLTNVNEVNAMPKADINGNHWFAQIPEGGDSMSNNTNQNNCNCGCSTGENKYPQGYWMPGCGCPPPPYPYPCPDAPVTPTGTSTEAQIAKLSKKSSVVRKQIEALTIKNKPIMISIGGCSYNYGTYTNTDGETTEYGEKILEILQAELEAIKAKIIELTQDLEADTSVDTGVEETVTSL